MTPPLRLDSWLALGSFLFRFHHFPLSQCGERHAGHPRASAVQSTCDSSWTPHTLSLQRRYWIYNTIQFILYINLLSKWILLISTTIRIKRSHYNIKFNENMNMNFSNKSFLTKVNLTPTTCRSAVHHLLYSILPLMSASSSDNSTTLFDTVFQTWYQPLQRLHPKKFHLLPEFY